MAVIEKLLVPWLAERNPTAVVTTETDDLLQTAPWTILVARAGGAKSFTIDRPRIVIDHFALSADGRSARDVVSDLADQVDRQILRELRGQSLGGCPVTLTTSVSGPSFVPDPNTALRRYTATYAISLGDAPSS